MTPAQQQSSDLIFLALTVWREARGESAQAQLAVAYSILQRVAHPSWWGSDVMTVVFDKWQYSSLTNPKDPQLVTWPDLPESKDPVWGSCVNAAEAALTCSQPNPAAGATHYYDDSIPAPEWAQAPAVFVAKIGKLNFWHVG